MCLLTESLTHFCVTEAKLRGQYTTLLDILRDADLDLLIGAELIILRN